MAIYYFKPGQTVTVPAGFAAVLATVPVSVIRDQADAVAMKLAGLAAARDQINQATEALQKTDAQLDADVVAHQARVDELKTARGLGGLQ